MNPVHVVNLSNNMSSTNIYHLLLLLWIYSPFVSNISDDNGCFQRDPYIECRNITPDKITSELKNIPASSTDALSFIGISGSFDLDISNFPGLAQVRSISFNQNNFDHFDLKVKQLRSLYLVDNILPAMHFDNCCKSLEKLYFRNNSGVPIRLRNFAELRSLKSLKIINQTMNQISRRTFEGLHRLKTLTIVNTNITSIEEDAFSRLDRLKELFLQDKNLKHIKDNVLRPLEELKSLTIYGDNLEPLSLNHFRKQKKLVQLGLPLETWRRIDIQQVPVAFPNLHSFTYIGEWKSEEEKNYFEDLFLNLHSLLVN